MLLALIVPPQLRACTLWGAAGKEAGGGTIVSKNRDWKPDHTQVLKMKRNGKGYAYFGLYAEGNDAPGMKQGVNENGLAVMTATAGAIPKKTREEQMGKGGLMSILLTDYATCDEVLADQEKLFTDRKPVFLLISDRKKIIVLEVGLGGRYAVKVVESGSVAHSNHYLEKSMSEFNLSTSSSSTTRVGRISELLKTAAGPCDTECFASMSKDQHDGENNSLWRTGKTGSRTLSSWILETPAQGAPKLRVLIANPGKPEETHHFVLDETFWKGTPAASSDHESRPLRVALFDDDGAGERGKKTVREQLSQRGMEVALMKGRDIAEKGLAGFDVVIFTGGSASKQGNALGEKGRENVRKFVRSGGGYVGICAGAYLACAGTNRVSVLSAKTVDPRWRRGEGVVKVEITPAGEEITGLAAKVHPIRYANGPIIQPDGRDDIAPYEPVAFFRTELARNGTPVGIMVDSPAIARGVFGKGRVVISSPHPESTDGLQDSFASSAVRWAAGNNQDHGNRGN